ncbi:hypothetical protein Droror1_Dr00019364 [Drosera rotundifolia]
MVLVVGGREEGDCWVDGVKGGVDGSRFMGDHAKGSRTPARLPIVVQRYLLEDEGLDYSKPQPGLLHVVISRLCRAVACGFDYKVKVDFNYVILQLYYQDQLFANKYVEPFFAMRGETRLASIEMVSNQVQLLGKVSQQLMVQIQNNTIAFQVGGLIHARSNFDSILRYSYLLYIHCNLVLTGPPSRVMITSKCKTMI